LSKNLIMCARTIKNKEGKERILERE